MAWGLPTCLGPEPRSVGRAIREDQDSLTQLLQLGLVVLVSDSGAGVVGWGGARAPRASLTPFPQGSQDRQDTDEPTLLRSVIVGLAVALVLVIVIMTTAFVCARKRCCPYPPVPPASPLPPDPTQTAGRGRKSLGFSCGRCVCIQSPATCCAILGRSAPLPEPQFPHLPSGHDTRFLQALEEAACISHLASCLGTSHALNKCCFFPLFRYICS